MAILKTNEKMSSSNRPTLIPVQICHQIEAVPMYDTEQGISESYGLWSMHWEFRTGFLHMASTWEVVNHQPSSNHQKLQTYFWTNIWSINALLKDVATPSPRRPATPCCFNQTSILSSPFFTVTVNGSQKTNTFLSTIATFEDHIIKKKSFLWSNPFMSQGFIFRQWWITTGVAKEPRTSTLGTKG